MIQGAHICVIEDVVVPEERWREVNKKKLAEIMKSLQEFGQLQPIILRDEGDKVLVDGLHRFTAARELAWETIHFVWTDEVDEIRLREIELEANIRRAEMTPVEREIATAKLHEMKMASDPTWTQRKTAEVTDRSQTRVAQAVKLSKMVELFPELRDAKTIKQAMSWMKQKATTIVRAREAEGNVDYAVVEEKILLGDSIEVIKSIPDESFNMVLTDPPFGIGYDSRKAGTDQSISAYEDSEESYMRILGMADDLYRVLKRNGWLIWFLGPTWYERAKETFRGSGFTVDEIPIIWDRSEGRSFTIRPDRYFARAYDMALHCIKGEPEVVQRNKPNIIRVAPVSVGDRELLVERPVELYQELIRRLTLKGESVADFFVGSGSVPAAAASLQRDFFGVELDPERRITALAKVKAHLPCNQ